MVLYEKVGNKWETKNEASDFSDFNIFIRSSIKKNLLQGVNLTLYNLSGRSLVNAKELTSKFKCLVD